MTQAWSDFIVDGRELIDIVDSLPSLGGLTARSCTLVRQGPTVVLRFDADSGLSPNAPEEWKRAGCQAVQFHLQFLDVAELRLEMLILPSEVELTVETHERSRLGVSIVGAGLALTFSCSDHLRVGRIGAFVNTDNDGASRLLYLRHSDRMRYARLPDTTDKNYYERI